MITSDNTFLKYGSESAVNRTNLNSVKAITPIQFRNKVLRNTQHRKFKF